MSTPPSEVRGALVVVASSGAAEVTAIAAQASGNPLGVLLDAVPGIVDYYLGASAALALDWYEELREESGAAGLFTPEPFTPLYVDTLREGMADIAREVEREMARDAELLSIDLDAEVAKLLTERASLMAEEAIAAGFRDTVTGNTENDPESVGWRRFARPEACKFCKMLAARGAVYKHDTARFAAHGAVTGGKRTGGDCMCIAGPAFKAEADLTEASVMQYVASLGRRTEKQRADLRAYLNHNFPDDRG